MDGRHLYMYAALMYSTESVHKLETHQEPTYIYYMVLCIMAECHEQAWDDIEEV
jgi:hypothetical protein